MGCGQSSNVPPDFPANIEVKQAPYETWGETIQVGAVWIAKPKNADECVKICNWAVSKQHTVRPMGHKTAWSPITYTKETKDEPKSICLDTTGMASISIDAANKQLTFGPGARQMAVMEALNKEGLAIGQFPGYGNLTMGGCLATGSHGWAGNAKITSDGLIPGSVANSVVSVTCIVSDDKGTYAVKKFDRDDDEGKAMIVTMGRTLLVEATMKVCAAFNARTVSTFKYDLNTSFGPENVEGSFQQLYEHCGRVSAIWCPYTEKIWYRYIEACPEQPESSRKVDEPYGYTFQNIGEQAWQTSYLENMLGNNAESVGERLAKAAEEPFTKGKRAPLSSFMSSWSDLCFKAKEAVGVNTVNRMAAVEYNQMSAMAMEMGNESYETGDLWGKWFHLLFYVTDGLRIGSNGIIIYCNHENIQRTVHKSWTIFSDLVNEMREENKYPLLMPLEYRCGGLDDPAYGGFKTSPSLSFLHYGEEVKKKGFDVALYIDNVFLPKTQDFPEFAEKLWERWNAEPLLSGDNAMLQVEWSKFFATTKDKGFWTKEEVLDQVRQRLPEWNHAMAVLEKYDNKNIFTNAFLQNLCKKI